MTSAYLNFPDIDPVLVSIGPLFGFGPLNIHWYGIMYAVAFGIAYWLASRQAAKAGSGWNKDQVSDLLFLGMLGVIIGGRIGYVLFYNFEHFIAEPLYLLKISQGGMSFHGGLLGVLLAMFWFAKRNGKSYLELGDFVAPLIPLGLAAGRLGNFINAELWGRTTDVPWAVLFPNAGGLPRHPSQLYHVALEGVLLFIIIIVVRRLKPATGTLGGVFLLGYGVFRFIVEFFREPDAHLRHVAEAGLTMGQWLCLPMIAAGLGLIIYVNSKPAVPVRRSK